MNYVEKILRAGTPGLEGGFTLATPDEIPEVSIFDVEADIDLVVEALASDQNALAKKIQADLKQALELSSPESILGAVRAVLDDHKDDLVRMLASAGAAAGLVGLAKLSQAIPQVVSLVEEPEPAQAIPPGQVTPAAQELVQDAVGELRGKRAILPTMVQGRIEAARRSANQVAQVQAQNAQQILQDTLAETVEEGGDVESFRSKVKQVLGERSFLADRHVENVFRTNVMEAYSSARLEMVESDPQVGSLYPYAAIHATHDDRVRPEHKAMETRGLDGTNVYRMDDPVFRKYRGPWDFGCRCVWRPLSVAQAARAGVLEAQRWQETGRAPAVPQHVPLPPFEVTSGFERQLATATTAGVNLVDLLLSAETPEAIELAWERDGKYRPKSPSRQGWVKLVDRATSDAAGKPLVTYQPADVAERMLKEQESPASPQNVPDRPTLTETWFQKLVEVKGRPGTTEELQALKDQARREMEIFEKAVPVRGWGESDGLRKGLFARSQGWRGANRLRERLKDLEKAGLIQAARDAAGTLFVARHGEPMPDWLVPEGSDNPPKAIRPLQADDALYKAPAPRRGAKYGETERQILFERIASHPYQTGLERRGRRLDEKFGSRGGYWSATPGKAAWDIRDELGHALGRVFDDSYVGYNSQEKVQALYTRLREKQQSVERMLDFFEREDVMSSPDALAEAFKSEPPNYFLREIAKEVLFHTFRVRGNIRPRHGDDGPSLDDVLDGKISPSEVNRLAEEKDRNREETDRANLARTKANEAEIGKALQSLPANASWQMVAARVRKAVPGATPRAAKAKGPMYYNIYEIRHPRGGVIEGRSKHAEGQAAALERLLENIRKASSKTDLSFALAWEAVESRSDNQKWVGVGEDKGKKAKYLPRGVDPNKGKKRTARTGTQKKAGDSTPPPETPADEGQRKPTSSGEPNPYGSEDAEQLIGKFNTTRAANGRLLNADFAAGEEYIKQNGGRLVSNPARGGPTVYDVDLPSGKRIQFVWRDGGPEKWNSQGRLVTGPAFSHWQILHQGRGASQQKQATPTAATEATKGKVLYSGVVLDKGSRAKLLKQFAQYIPKGWKPLAHHMTTAFGKALPEGLAGLDGELRVTHIGWDKELGVVAVQVESDIPSENNIPHITLAVSPTGKPKDSNRITNWKPVARPLVLQGKAQDVHAEDKPRPKLTGMAKELAAAAEGARELAEELRARGDNARADHLEGLAKKYAADSERMAGK